MQFMVNNMQGYEKLDDVLARAFDQASKGKGDERHATSAPFHEQPMQQVADQVGLGFITGQAIKKIVEAQKLPPDQAVQEYLGAINYIAGAVIFTEKKTTKRNGFNEMANVMKNMTEAAKNVGPLLAVGKPFIPAPNKLINREEVREILSEMERGSIAIINGYHVQFNNEGFFDAQSGFCGHHRSTSLKSTLNYIFKENS